MALADIISRIESDAAEEAAVIVAQAQEHAESLIAAAERDAVASSATTLAAAQRGAAADASSLVANARLQARDDAVRARGDVLAETLTSIVAAIEALPADRYAEYLGNLIADNVRAGDTVALAAADQPIAEQVRRVVGERVDPVAVDWAAEPAPLARGAAVFGNRTRLTLTPESVIEARRDELAIKIATSLFAPEGA